MYKLRVKASFEAAHHLPWHEKCCRVHGHTYHVEFVVGAARLDEHDIVMDLGALREVCRHLVGYLDHTDLNDTFENPTVETIAAWLYVMLVDAIAGLVDRDRVSVVEVTVWETDTGGVTYDG